MKIDETCSCGAELHLTDQWSGTATRAAEMWRKEHQHAAVTAAGVAAMQRQMRLVEDLAAVARDENLRLAAELREAKAEATRLRDRHERTPA